MKLAWVVVLLCVSSAVSIAAPVKEYVDAETGALVFDASGDNTDFDAPTEPREFGDVEEYLHWVLGRFHGRPVFNADGLLIDVRGGWVLLGRPTYTVGERTYVVTQPVLQTISGPFGFVIVGGDKYEMPLDESRPPLEEIEPAIYSLINHRRSCSGAPLTGVEYCVVTSAFKHIYLFYQSIGGTVDIAGNAIVAPSTSIQLTLNFRDAFNRTLQISTPTTTRGAARATGSGVPGLGIAEWGVFGNPFVDPTKILALQGNADGPLSTGGTGNAESSWSQRYP